ncbi:MAG: hypothetical protein ABI333_06560 [bacterium]
MKSFIALIGDVNLMTGASLLFGACAVLAGIAQLVWLRRINLMPAVIGLIAITFFASVLGQTMGLVDALLALGGSAPAERIVLFSREPNKVTMPMFYAFVLLILATLLGSIAALIRANRKQSPLSD